MTSSATGLPRLVSRRAVPERPARPVPAPAAAPHLEVPSEVLARGPQPRDVLQRGAQLQPDPLQGKRQRERPSARLGSPRLRSLPGSYLPPWPRRVPGTSRRRRAVGAVLAAPVSPGGFSPLLRGFSAGFGWLFFPPHPPPRCTGALSQAGRRLPLLSAALKPPGSPSCPQPRWRPAARPVTAPAPGGRSGGPGPGERGGPLGGRRGTGGRWGSGAVWGGSGREQGERQEVLAQLVGVRCFHLKKSFNHNPFLIAVDTDLGKTERGARERKGAGWQSCGEAPSEPAGSPGPLCQSTGFYKNYHFEIETCLVL